jgi:hypothetical protein
MSILPMSIIGAKARLASAPPAAGASVNTRGVICQEIPQRSLHKPHAISSPPLLKPQISFVCGSSIAPAGCKSAAPGPSRRCP